jgi:hypothetical protein
MDSEDSIDLYKLLPAHYRIKDSEQGYKLKALLDIISDQANIIKRDIDGLWDDFFIETCRPWVIPYIADLVSNNTLQEGAARSRADVANTIYYRKRKGTLPVLEELAEDVTGWGAHAVALFELLGWTQNLNHLRYSSAPNSSSSDPNSLSKVGTVNLRDAEALGLVGGPFDILSHSVDIRPLSQSEGWYNIRKVAFFLWRLNNYPINSVTPKRSSFHPYGYHFSPLGNPVPLFNQPVLDMPSSELNVPGQIQSMLFCQNPGDYYGLDRSLCISICGTPVSFAAIECLDLSSWDRPKPTIEKVRGILSGEISSFSWSSRSPELEIVIGSNGPYLTQLSPVPHSLEEVQMALQMTIRGAHSDPEFSEAKVLLVDNRLLVLSGAGGGPVVFTASSKNQADTIADLSMDNRAQQVQGIFSGNLNIIPKLTSSPSLEVGVTIGGEGPHVAKLSEAPKDITNAQSVLQKAIRGASSARAFADVKVFHEGNRLLILSDQKISFSETPADRATFWELALSDKIAAIDVLLGRFTFTKGHEPKSDDISVYYNYGFSANMGGGSYGRRDTLGGPKDAWNIYVCKSGKNGMFSSLKDALNSLPVNTDLSAAITIIDNATYVETDISIDMRCRKELVIQAENQARPNIRLSGDLKVKGRAGAVLTLNGMLIEGGIFLDENVEKVKILHSTLVPGRYLDEGGKPLDPDTPSIVVDNKNNRLNLEIDHSISGPIRIPAGAAGIKIRDSIIDKGRAMVIPALISGRLEHNLNLSSSQPSMNIEIGSEGPYKIEFPPGSNIMDLEKAKQYLEMAIRSASKSPAFARARVMVIDDRFVLLSGSSAGDISINVSGDNDITTANELKLNESLSRKALASVSGDLSKFPKMSSDFPSLNLTIGLEGPYKVKLESKPNILADACFFLQNGIAALSSEAFNNALVGSLDGGRLVVLPGKEDVLASFEATQNDETTVNELALLDDRPSIASNDEGYHPGPASILERSTFFGSVNVKELELASDVIFMEKVLVDLRQAGCVRYSYLPDESQTPRRYHCQPDMAVDKQGGDSLSKEKKDLIRERIRPSFSSVHYGDPAYAQLSLICAEEIKTGAEDGSEMGVFCCLHQPQKNANLRIRLKEYLPFGLEYGFIYVT